MREDDVPAVLRVADEVHPGLPEGAAMFRDRLALYPEGALVLDGDGRVGGYALAYPIERHAPPALDTVLGRLAEGADALYLHDVALLNDRRGRGLAAPAIHRLLNLGERFAATALVSVYGTQGLWRRYGFEPAPGVVSAAKLVSYGPDAVFMLRPNASNGG